MEDHGLEDDFSASRYDGSQLPSESQFSSENLDGRSSPPAYPLPSTELIAVSDPLAQPPMSPPAYPLASPGLSAIPGAVGQQLRTPPPSPGSAPYSASSPTWQHPGHGPIDSPISPLDLTSAYSVHTTNRLGSNLWGGNDPVTTEQQNDQPWGGGFTNFSSPLEQQSDESSSLNEDGSYVHREDQESNNLGAPQAGALESVPTLNLDDTPELHAPTNVYTEESIVKAVATHAASKKKERRKNQRTPSPKNLQNLGHLK